MSDRYERVFEVTLLDDLHNYFPALLYQQDSFQTVQDVLGYVRERTERRFNLFDYGRRQYENTIPIPLFPRNTNTYIPQPQADDVRVEFTNPTFPLFRSLGITTTRRTGLGAGTGVATGIAIPPYQDVIVHASQAIIDSGSTQETLSNDLDSICTICQDRLRQGELVRKLTVCGHSFHTICIDPWLLSRSVRCPTCRHDIRELTLATATTGAAISSPPSPLLTSTATATATGNPNATNGSRLRQRSTNEELTSTEIMNLLFGRLV